MDNVGQVITLVGAVCGLIVLLTGALVFVRGSYTKARIDALTGLLNDYERREKNHEREVGECKDQINLLRTQVQALTSENLVLQEAVTQKAAVEALKIETQRQHAELMGVMVEIRDATRGSN